MSQRFLNTSEYFDPRPCKAFSIKMFTKRLISREENERSNWRHRVFLELFLPNASAWWREILATVSIRTLKQWSIQSYTPIALWPWCALRDTYIIIYLVSLINLVHRWKVGYNYLSIFLCIIICVCIGLRIFNSAASKINFDKVAPETLWKLL